MLTGEYCNRIVAVAGKNDTVVEAAKLMREYHAGNVLIVESMNGARRPVGIVTDRDIVIKVLAEEVDINMLDLKDIMTDKLVTVKENDDLMATIKCMRENGVRRVPVVDEKGGLKGILAVDDVIDVITEQLMDIDQLISKEQSNEKKLIPLSI